MSEMPKTDLHGDTPQREFWRDLKPIKQVFRPGALPEAYIQNAPTDDDRSAASRTAAGLLESSPGILVAAGGDYADDLAPGVVRLPSSIAEAAAVVEETQA